MKYFEYDKMSESVEYFNQANTLADSSNNDNSVYRRNLRIPDLSEGNNLEFSNELYIIITHEIIICYLNKSH